MIASAGMNWKPAVVVLGIVVGAWLILRPADLSPPRVKLDEAELVRVISHGESVALVDHVGKEGWTIALFTADW